MPQGSVISPILFLLFLNDLLRLTTNPIYSFADHSRLEWAGTVWITDLSLILWKLRSEGLQIEWNLTHVKPKAVCYRTSQSPILAKTFIWVAGNDRRLFTLGHIDTIWHSLGWSCFQCVEKSSVNAFWSGVRNTSLLPISALSMLPILERKWNTIYIYGQVLLKAQWFRGSYAKSSVEAYRRWYTYRGYPLRLGFAIKKKKI